MLGSKYRFSVPQNHGLTSRECPHRCFRHDRTMTSPTSTEQKKRGGRPKQPKGTQRTHPVKVYFDDANYRKLLRIQRRDNTPLSTLVYNLAVNGYVKEPISRELTKYIRDLSGMANNLNQLHTSDTFTVAWLWQSRTNGWHNPSVRLSSRSTNSYSL